MATILIVDDRAINREALYSLLDEHGYTVLEAEEGLLAIELACKHTVDLIITDIAMPRMDGLTLARELQLHPLLKKIPVIFYTATYKAAEAYRMANAPNVRHVLTKPCHPEIILGTIEGVLDPNSVLFNHKITKFSENQGMKQSKINFQESGKKDRFESINLRLISLIEISLDISLEQDIKKLICILCKGGRQLLDAYYAGVIMHRLNSSKQHENFMVNHDSKIVSYKFHEKNLSESLKEIFLSEKSVLIHSPIIDVEKIGIKDIALPFSSILSLPLKTSRSFYGKIYFINKFNKSVFSPSDKRFMMTLSDKFAIHYENLILRQEIEQHSQQLQEITERLHLTLEAANLGTWSWSIKTGELIWDKYACLLFGLNPEAIPRTIDAFLTCLVPEDQKRVSKALFGINKKGKSNPVTFRIIWSDQSIHHCTLRGKIYYDAKGEPVRMLGVYWDITEHVQAEEKFRTYQKQVAETVRSNSLGEMVSSIAHEINQPLTAISAYIKGCVRRIENKNEVTSEIINILNEANNQAERAGEIVHRIKNYVRKGELFYEKIDINIVVAQAIHLIKQEIQNIAVEIIYTPNKSLNQVKIDKIQIEQVILNLLRNAIEAMQEANTNNPQITIDVGFQKSRYITVRVMDNGPGFSEQIANHLFDLYFTTKLQGMGLGLAISRSIIEAHSGQLSASLLPQGGSCFEFDLPIKTKSVRLS